MFVVVYSIGKFDNWHRCWIKGPHHVLGNNEYYEVKCIGFRFQENACIPIQCTWR